MKIIYNYLLNIAVKKTKKDKKKKRNLSVPNALAY